MTWSEFFAVLAGVAGTRFWEWAKFHYQFPYQFKCTQCKSTFNFNNAAALATVRDNHLDNHLKENIHG